MSGRFIFEAPGCGVTFEADRIRRDHNELIAELSVKCDLPGARSVNGYVSTGDFNLSSVRARSERAKLLKERSRTNGNVDWFALLEDFAQRIFALEREGEPACDLRTLPRPQRGDEFRIEGLVFPRRHPSIIFGDGGSAKSYTVLYLGGKLAQRGLSVALFDWELCGDDHRERLELLFGSDMPPILYSRCERPLVYEADRVRRIVRDSKVDYAIFDSVAFACDGPPESAESAGRYFRAIRELPCGSLHVAHTNRSEAADQKPFGSIFWHNGARQTWFTQATEPEPDGSLTVGFFNRKSNLNSLARPVGFKVSFRPESTVFERTRVEDNPDLVGKLTLRQQMIALLQRGSMLLDDLAEELDANHETISRTARRYRSVFVVLQGNRIGLTERGR